MVPAEPAYLQVARLLAERIDQEWPGYTPGHQLPSIASMARQMALGIDAIRDAYQLLVSMGILSSRQGYGAVVRPKREREVIHAPPDATVETRMPTFVEIDEWDLEPGVPMLVVDGRAYPGDRYVVRSATLGENA